MSIVGKENMANLTPHLVRLHDSERLYRLAREKDPKARQELSTAITDLFAHATLSVREQEIIADILITMLRQAEKELREAIAARMATMENAPLRVVLYLSNDDIEVASPILSQSPLLEDMDLMYIIQSRDTEYWQAIARRERLNPSVINALAYTRDVPTAETLLQNPTITIPDESFKVFTDMAKYRLDLQRSLLSHPMMPAELKAAIYTYVGEKMESELKALDSSQAEAISEAVAEITLELVDASYNEYRPTPAMVQAAESLYKTGRLDVWSMQKALKLGQIASFVAMMSVRVSLPLDETVELIADESGEGLAVLCQAARATKKDFMSMYLMTAKFRSGQRVVNPMSLNQALQMYDRMTPEGADARLKKLRQ